uniref:PHD finger protein 10 n=1 Tax=Syphacia muris TaxID=451379 RepID=A0A0N5ABX7_9BILA
MNVVFASDVVDSKTDNVKESTKTSVCDSAEKSGKKPLTKSSSSRVITADTTHILIEPSHIIEYEWPPKSGERFFIQEQIAELLDVKSFKRKYPDLNRHTIEINEREYLLNTYKLASVMMRAIEVHELMASDYSAIYSVAEKAKLQIIKMDTRKLQELRKNAIRSAFEFNADMNSIKNTERRHFWDIQTSIIQSAQNRWKRMEKSATRPSPYPVALIPGQYQHYYKRFTPSQLCQLPLNSVLEYEHLLPLKKERSPSPINVRETTLDSLNDTQSNDFTKMETLGTRLQSPMEINHQVR